MKICLSLGENDIIRSGYVNIDPLCDPNHPQRIKADIGNLGLYADPGEVVELVAIDILDYVNIGQKEEVLNGWLNLIAINGQIVLGGTDLTQATKAFAFGHIDLQKVNNLLYGQQIAKSGVTTCHQLCTLLSSKGYRIVEKKILDFSYIVKAERIN